MQYACTLVQSRTLDDDCLSAKARRQQCIWGGQAPARTLYDWPRWHRRHHYREMQPPFGVSIRPVVETRESDGGRIDRKHGWPCNKHATVRNSGTENCLIKVKRCNSDIAIKLQVASAIKHTKVAAGSGYMLIRNQLCVMSDTDTRLSSYLRFSEKHLFHAAAASYICNIQLHTLQSLSDL